MLFRSVFDELDSQKVLVDVQNRRNHDGDGEVFFNETVVQVEFLLDKLPVVVTVIPDVELSVKWKTFLGMIFFLHGKKNLEFLVGGWAKFLLEVSEELVQELNDY